MIAVPAPLACLDLLPPCTCVWCSTPACQMAYGSRCRGCLGLPHPALSSHLPLLPPSLPRPPQHTCLACGLVARGAVSASDLPRNVERLRSHIKLPPWNAGECGAGGLSYKVWLPTADAAACHLPLAPFVPTTLSHLLSSLRLLRLHRCI